MGTQGQIGIKGEKLEARPAKAALEKPAAPKVNPKDKGKPKYKKKLKAGEPVGDATRKRPHRE